MIAPLQVDVTGWFITALTTALSPVLVAEERPANLGAGTSRMVQVDRVGGPNDSLILDNPTMAFSCFAPTMAEANQLGYRVITTVLGLRGAPQAGAVVTEVRILSGPRRVENENPGIRHAAVLIQPRIKTTFT